MRRGGQLRRGSTVPAWRRSSEGLARETDRADEPLVEASGANDPSLTRVARRPIELRSRGPARGSGPSPYRRM